MLKYFEKKFFFLHLQTSILLGIIAAGYKGQISSAEL